MSIVHNPSQAIKTVMEINRKGTCVEYKKGHHYLTYTQWEDGHCEIEVHKCVPELIFHSCDMKELDLAKEMFRNLPDLERKELIQVKQSQK